MVEARICIYHRVRLFGECLVRTLDETQSFRCRQSDHAELSRGVARSDESFEILLVDAGIPAGDLAEICRSSYRQATPCKLLLLISPEMSSRLAALRELGGHGYVWENGSVEELCSAIRTVLKGDPYVSDALKNALFQQFQGSGALPQFPRGGDDRLTQREREILRLITWDNLSNKEIARRLKVSQYTVKNHVHSIIEKLGVDDRHAAARLARSRNYVNS